ncbi:MAG: outer membrane protein assembly factor BamD [Saprospiraceae bacterium]
MRKILGCLLVGGLILLTISCKSSYEKIRTSNDPDLILKTAFDSYDKAQYQRAQTLFELVLTNIRGKAEAEKANFQYAYTHYQLKQYVLAAYYFKTFANTFTNSPFREEAAFMSAYSNYQQSPSYRLDQSDSQKAIEEFQVFVNLFPESKRVEECNRLIDELRRKLEQKAFAEGELYYNLRQYQSSVISFDNLLRDYPESPDIERVQYLIARGSFLLGENSVVDKKAERYQTAAKRAADFLEKYPASKYAKEVRQIQKNSEEAAKNVKKRLKTTGA